MNNFINNSGLPFCKGCGHSSIAENTEKALNKLGKDILDVILVTDIGCHGIIDKSFNTHTVHGLHGRSVALASGVSAAVNNPDKKVIVFIGDGGATIGMQHIIDAAHNGFNLTVVIHNNMLYGMTGGQPSEYTPTGFKTPTLPEGSKKIGYNICEIIAAAGANYVSRIVGIGDFSDALAEAFAKPGFSLVEVMEICPSYGVKSNPGMKLSKIIEGANMDIKVFVNRDHQSYKTDIKENPKSLIYDELALTPKFKSDLKNPVRIMLCGSAGEGVQLAAELLAKAGMNAGLNVSKKGSYPVTVGIGFSASEIILSPEPILYTGSPVPDVSIICSKDGLDFGNSASMKMSEKGHLYIDSELEKPQTNAKITDHNFREKLGGRNSALMGVFYYVNDSKVIPLDALIDVYNANKISTKLSVDSFLSFH
jgi:2-oxoglutarate/2-oxoacid ferredoxin oxidoreductase subunit beta